MRLERQFKKKEERYQEEHRSHQRELQDVKEKNVKLEQTCQAMKTTNSEELRAKIIELTKQNAISDVKLLRLTRELTNLAEQERMIRREYNKIDTENAEKDRYLQERIYKLKEWKAKALFQMDQIYQKLKMAVPISEFQEQAKELQVVEMRQRGYQKKIDHWT